ncbi:MAG: hypothetical protein ACYC3S_15005 [Chloroflexota bacterium]
MEDFASPDRLTKWLALVETPLDEIASEHQRFYLRLYPNLRAVYEAAGSPCGTTEADLRRWWQKRANHERARWLATHRRMYTGAADRFTLQ